MTKWEGMEKETEEMRPQWWDEDKVSVDVFPCKHFLAQVPFAQMWPDDEMWFPYMLR